jgi:hypothetical protein
MRKSYTPDSLSSITVIRPAVITCLLLLIPLIAMQYSDEVNWGVLDFVTAGMLLFAAGVGYEAVAQKIHTYRSRILIGLAITLGIAVIWAQLAVGIFD